MVDKAVDVADAVEGRWRGLGERVGLEVLNRATAGQVPTLRALPRSAECKPDSA
jgi:hypothetical protein